MFSAIVSIIVILAYSAESCVRFLTKSARSGIRPSMSMYVCSMYGHHIQQSMDQSGKVANPARGQLKQVKLLFPCPRACLRIWSREKGSAVPTRVSLLISILRLNLVYE